MEVVDGEKERSQQRERTKKIGIVVQMQVRELRGDGKLDGMIIERKMRATCSVEVAC